jgi:hypothetical protein
MKSNNPIDIRAQTQRQEAGEQARKLVSMQEADDLKWLMDDPRGRRIVWRMLEQTGVFRSSFTGNSETYFREGQRNIGLKLLADLHEHTPDAYIAMIQERKTK